MDIAGCWVKKYFYRFDRIQELRNKRWAALDKAKAEAQRLKKEVTAVFSLSIAFIPAQSLHILMVIVKHGERIARRL